MQESQIQERIREIWNFPLPSQSKILFIGLHPIFTSAVLDGNLVKMYAFEPNQTIASMFQNENIVLESKDLTGFMQKFAPFDVIVFSAKIPQKQEIAVSIKELQDFQKLKEQEKANYQKAKTLLKDLETIQYQDEELEKLFSSTPEEQKSFIPQFLETLLSQGQISQRQYDQYFHRFSCEESQLAIRFEVESCIDCIQHYLSKNGLFIGFVDEEFSFFNEPCFLEEILTDPLYSFEEKTLPKEYSVFFARLQEGIPKCFIVRKGEES